MLSEAELQHIVLAKQNGWTEFYPVGRDAEMAEELLSLREQLAELKALEPVAWTDAVELRGMAKDGCGYLFKVNPANPYIYPTQSECQQISTLIKERKPDAVLMCSEVYR